MMPMEEAFSRELDVIMRRVVVAAEVGRIRSILTIVSSAAAGGRVIAAVPMPSKPKYVVGAEELGLEMQIEVLHRFAKKADKLDLGTVSVLLLGWRSRSNGGYARDAEAAVIAANPKAIVIDEIGPQTAPTMLPHLKLCTGADFEIRTGPWKA